MTALSALLDSLIDYAGLFPPAKLPMAEAVANHAAYLDGPHAFALGRFVAAASRLAEFESARGSLQGRGPAADVPWRLSALAGADPRADAAAIAAFNSRRPGAVVDAVEGRAASPAEIAALDAAFPKPLELWIEIPSSGDPAPLLAAIRAAGRGAKIRTGGVTPEAFPPPAEVARFLAACRDAGVACKATAGLHHPLRADYRLTYEPGSAKGTMFGFLNVFLAAVRLHLGDSAGDAAELLADGDPGNFSATPGALSWRGRGASAAQIAAARRDLCRSFGSCSFAEPIEGLQELKWL
jgi:hypothetical protein